MAMKRLACRTLYGALGLGLLALGCNAIAGAGAAVVLAGAGYFASQCYDSVRIRVRDGETGRYTCEAEVRVVDADGGDRNVRPCYHAALTEGHWTVTARKAGYVPASSAVEVPERRGPCPRYTHSVELTLEREGAAAKARALRPPPQRPAAQPAPSALPPAVAPPGTPLAPAGAPDAGAPPPPAPEDARVPTRAFEVVPSPAPKQ
jgi:hypothetical protein